MPVIVRPKNDGQDTRVRHEYRVIRRDPETGIEEEYQLFCVEGRFFDAYPQLGLIHGDTPFDPYADMDAGRMAKYRVATYR